MREWKPGDVALVSTPCCGDMPATRNYDGTWHVAGSKFPATICPVDDARPLVVIDPEDREAVARLMGAYYGGKVSPGSSSAIEMQAALRSLIEPPKCPAALNIAGEHFGCDQPLGHGMAHGNTEAAAIWGESE